MRVHLLTAPGILVIRAVTNSLEDVILLLNFRIDVQSSAQPCFGLVMSLSHFPGNFIFREAGNKVQFPGNSWDSGK
jgi:hypothetical protein